MENLLLWNDKERERERGMKEKKKEGCTIYYINNLWALLIVSRQITREMELFRIACQ